MYTVHGVLWWVRTVRTEKAIDIIRHFYMFKGFNCKVCQYNKALMQVIVILSINFSNMWAHVYTYEQWQADWWAL